MTKSGTLGSRLEDPPEDLHPSHRTRAGALAGPGFASAGLFALFALVLLACGDLRAGAPLVAGGAGARPPDATAHCRGAAAPEVDFEAARIFPAGADLAGVAAADLDGDGAPDLVMADAARGVLVLQGRGDGTFGPPRSFAAEALADCIAVGDFDGDHHLDVAVAGAAGVGVLLGRGDGTLQRVRRFGAALRARSIAVGDFDDDGRLDVVVAGDDAVGVLLGSGDGALRAGSIHPAGSGVRSLRVGDFDGDQRLDVAVVSPLDHAVIVLPGRGDGTLLPPRKTFLGGVGVGAVPRELSAGDLDRDGVLDVAVATSQDGVEVLIGRGDGTFSEPARFAAGSFPQGIELADVDDDQKLDLVVARDEGVDVLLGAGDGSFQAPWSFRANLSLRGLAVADLDGDGCADLAVATVQEVIVPLGRGDGSFRAARSFLSGSGPEGVVAVDMNGDGILDLVTANFYGGARDDGSVGVMLGEGDATFRAPRLFLAGARPSALAAGDLDGDGELDVVVSNKYAHELHVLRGERGGALGPARRLEVHGGSGPVAVGDFDGDGRLDVVAGSELEEVVEVLPGNGDGTLRAPIATPIGSLSRALVAADLDGDGKLDLAIAGTTARQVIVLLGRGDGTFRVPIRRAIDAVPQAISAADFDGDGVLDVAVGDASTGSAGGVSVLLGRGGGALTEARRYPVAQFPTALAVGDFDRDGRTDLAAASYDGLALVLGRGDGTFRVGPAYSAGTNPTGLAAGDFDRDGALDAAVTSDHSVTVLRNVTRAR